ncbi:MAG TPA: NUDIX domain-containing protein [Acidimicrobiales bacterium]|nr:NUDIX domain-containing protein [Acidimicrobiales bacterium]
MTDRPEPSEPNDAQFFTPVRWARLLEPRQRLEAEMARTRIDLAVGLGSDPCAARKRADALRDTARSASDRGHREAAWALLLDARREMAYLRDERERDALAVSLRKETSKVGGWRKAAMEELLGPRCVPDAARLYEAQFHLDNTLANDRRKRRARRTELLISTVTLVIALGAIAVVLRRTDGLPSADLSFANGPLVALAVLFGVVGACVSTLQRVATRPWKGVPGERDALLASVVRPASGAASALLVVAAAQADLLGGEPSSVLIAAFAAGFTERYILRFIGDDEKNPDKDQEQKRGEEGERAAPPPPRREATSAGNGNGPSPGGYFRAGVGVVVQKVDGRILALERVDHPGAWQLPQGGLEADEDAEAAARRELREETGLQTGVDVELVRALTDWVAYELPEDAQSTKTGLGQVQKWFEFRPLREDLAPTLDSGTTPAEFRDFKWMRPDELVEGAVEFRRAVYREVVKALGGPAEASDRGEGAPTEG